MMAVTTARAATRASMVIHPQSISAGSPLRSGGPISSSTGLQRASVNE
jgi:hypothetical protein